MERKSGAAVAESDIWIGRLAAGWPAVCLLLFCGAGAAQEPPARKVAEAVRTLTPPRVDGELDDPVWAEAAVIEDLHQYEPLDHGEPTEQSIFYVLYDDENLYVAARLLDSEPEAISARQMIQGQSVSVDDRIELILDPFNSLRTGYKFQLNPNGVRRDGIFDGATNVNEDWDGIWHAEAAVDAEGWTGEITIPFKTLNFDPENADWGFTVARAIPRKKESMAWTSYDRGINPGSAGVLSGLSGLRQGRGLDVIPSISVASQRDFIAAGQDTRTEPSMDVFYNFTPSLTGVLTFNTDFSATEVDDRQVNLTRFSTFFPEKRDFFLQNVDIFSFGPEIQRGRGRNGIPFFSRRIGLSDRGQAVDIDAGAKLTGRVGRFNVGVLAVDQRGYEGRTGFVEDSRLFVGRASANVLEESSVGLIFTDGDPRSNDDNSLAGADFRYRNTSLPSGRTVEGALWYQRSETQGIDTDASSWGFEFALPASEGLFGKVEYEVIQRNFLPALGFVNRSDIERARAWAGYRRRPRGHPWIRSVQSFLSIQEYDNYTTGNLETGNLWFRPFRIQNHRGDQYSVLLKSEREVLTQPFEIADGVSIPAGDYEFSGYSIDVEWAAERVIAPSLVYGEGDYYGGTRREIQGGLAWRPSSRWYVNANYGYNDIELAGGHVTTRLIQLRANLAFNVKWSWVNLVQYDNVSHSTGINSRLRWNPRAGEDLHIVWNHEFDALAAFSRLHSRRSEFTVKYSRTFRF